MGARRDAPQLHDSGALIRSQSNAPRATGATRGALEVRKYCLPVPFGAWTASIGTARRALGGALRQDALLGPL